MTERRRSEVPYTALGFLPPSDLDDEAASFEPDDDLTEWVEDLAESDADQFPIIKFGSRWLCDGPDGRFHTRTRAEAERLLAEALAKTFSCPECGGEMVRSPLDPGFLMHVESTDCSPEPWPTPQASEPCAHEERTLHGQCVKCHKLPYEQAREERVVRVVRVELDVRLDDTRDRRSDEQIAASLMSCLDGGALGRQGLRVDLSEVRAFDTKEENR